MFLLFTLSSCNDETDAVPTWEVFDGHIEQTYWEGTALGIHNQLLLNNLQVISQKYGRNL